MSVPEARKRTSRKPELWGRVVGGLLGALAVIVIFYSIPSGVSPRDIGGALVILTSLTFAWTYPLAAIHEAGHALAAYSQRFRIWWFHVGPLVFASPNVKSVRASWIVERREPLGSVAAYPIDGKNLRRRFLILSASGPVASIATFALALAISGFATTRESIAGEYFSRSALIAASVLLLTTLIPVGSSDASTILQTLRGKSEVERGLALFGVIASSCSGLRPRDWNADLMSVLAGDDSRGTVAASTSIMAYYHAIDRKATEAAGRALEAASCCDLADEPEAKRLLNAINIEAAFFAAEFRRDLATAQSHREKVDEAVIHRHDVLRADAAIASLEGNSARASALAYEAIGQQDVCKDLGWTIAERELLDRYIQSDAPQRPVARSADDEVRP